MNRAGARRCRPGHARAIVEHGLRGQRGVRRVDVPFITPNLCDDGHDGDGTGAAGKGCVNGDPGGLATIDAFLKKWVPLIQASPAYQKDGLIIINFDESADTSIAGSSSDPVSGKTTYTINLPGQACCGQKTGPNVTRPGDSIIPASATLEYKLHYVGVGGDRTGAVLLSRWIAPGTVSYTQYNHYSLLRSLENIFQTNGYLGYADDASLTTFATTSSPTSSERPRRPDDRWGRGEGSPDTQSLYRSPCLSARAARGTRLPDS